MFAYPKPGPRFPMTYVMVFCFVFRELRCSVIVSFNLLIMEELYIISKTQFSQTTYFVWPKGNNSRNNYFINILNYLFWETTEPFEITFDWNLPLMVLNKMYIFHVDQKSKMTATAVHLSCSGGHLGYLNDYQQKMVWGPGHVINIYTER